MTDIKQEYIKQEITNCVKEEADEYENNFFKQQVPLGFQDIEIKEELTESFEYDEEELPLEENNEGQLEVKEPLNNLNKKVGVDDSKYDAESLQRAMAYLNTLHTTSNGELSSSENEDFQNNNVETVFHGLEKILKEHTLGEHSIIQGHSSEVRNVKGKRKKRICRRELLKCEYCYYTTFRKGHMNLHKSSHLGVNNIHCDYCSYGTNRKSNLKRHLHVHHNIETGNKSRPVTLPKNRVPSPRNNGKDIVGSKCESNDSMSELKFECEECGYRTRDKKRLRVHMLVHFGNKVHVCDVCGYKTNYKHCLKRHCLVHERKKRKKDSLERDY